jgi:phenylpyruvate tautomerase PptA (4-oxalocrotonate tautomerase family)
MPLVRIDHSDARANPAAIANAVHEAIVAVYRIPARDRFQIVTSHGAGSIIAEDAGLGFERVDPVVIQIFTQRGRTDEAKSALYAEIADRLGEVGVEPRDVFIGYVENGPQDWSFGFGRAQYMTGELAVPGARGGTDEDS